MRAWLIIVLLSLSAPAFGHTRSAVLPFTHDAKGNLTGGGQRVLPYDDENQFIRMEVPGQWKTEFGYDGLGRRRWKREFNGSGTLLGETRYLYDGRLALQERDGNNTPLATYTRGLDLSGALPGQDTGAAVTRAARAA